MSFIDRMKPEDVVDDKTFTEYVAQNLGTPFNTGKDIATLRRKSKELFNKLPNADWQTLVRTCGWARARRRRPHTAWLVVDWVRFAWADGYLPELDEKPEDQALEDAIRAALEVEQDPEWRRRLAGSEGRARKEVFVAWQNAFSSSSL